MVRRLRSVFGMRVTSLPPMFCTCCDTCSVPFARSMSFQRRPHTSPRLLEKWIDSIRQAAAIRTKVVAVWAYSWRHHHRVRRHYHRRRDHHRRHIHRAVANAAAVWAAVKAQTTKAAHYVISGVAVCAGADKMGKAWTLNEINDTSALLTRIKANLFDIDKTPLRLAARRADLARPITIAEELEREAPIHSTLDFSPLAIMAVHIRKEGTDPPR